MKQVKLLSTAVFAAAAFALFSCNSSENTTPATDSTSMSTTTTTMDTTMSTPPASAAPMNIMVAMHKVANFTKWKASYDAHDSMRLASGLHNFVIGRGVDDSNMVLVAVTADDVDKARAFSKDANLKEAMKKGGVMGAPEFKIVKTDWMDASTNSSTLRSIVSYKVKDYEQWKTNFLSNKQLRMDNGVVDRVFGHDVDNDKMVTAAFVITDSAKARAFVKSDIVKQKMKESGVEGEPKRFMYHVVQQY